MNTFKVIRCSLLSAPLLASSLCLAAGPIVISDGPEGTTSASTGAPSSNHSTIQISDGPMEWTAASRAGKKLTGSWIVESNGPGTGKLVGAKGAIVTSDGPTTVATAPVAPPAPSVSPASKVEVSEAPVKKHVSAAPHRKKAVPDAEASTLAPVVALPKSPVKPLASTPKKVVVKQVADIVEWNHPDDSQFFYVYADKTASKNHFLPGGWMGDYGDIRFEDASAEQPHSGDTCIRINYLARSSQDNGWAGMYWQTPVNNWGDKAGGYDLSGKKSLTFWARGAKGGETLAEFRVGGIGGANGDSDTANIGPIVLSKTWTKYTISLTQTNLHHIIGGFSWSANRKANPEGITFFLDDIRYE